MRTLLLLETGPARFREAGTVFILHEAIGWMSQYCTLACHDLIVHRRPPEW